MKKAVNKKLTAILALVSALSSKPANALSNLAKGGIVFVAIAGITGGGFLIKHLLDDKKENGDGEDNKKSPKIKQKGQYYDENIKMLTENSKISKEYIDKLIGFINSKDNDFLGEIVYISLNFKNYHKNFDGKNCEGMDWRAHWGKIDDNVVKKAGLSKGNSWVEELFDRLRGSAKIVECSGISDSVLNLLKIFFDDKVYEIKFMTSTMGEALRFDVDDAKDYVPERNITATYLVSRGKDE